jgi:glycosyltransferase involved in cell wall biosynthesis
MKDFVSILIPNYNKANYLKKTLDSIMAQTYSNWECIIVDDHSTDNSWEIVEGYAKIDSRIKIFKRPNHLSKGGNACRNYAFTNSIGKFVVFFDSDDLLYANALEDRVNAISNSNYDFCVSNGILWNGKDKTGLLISNWTEGDILNAFINFEPLWLTQGVIIRRDFIEKNTITWDEKVPFYQDVLYNLKLVFLSKNYGISSEVDWVWYVSSNTSLGSKTKSVNSYSDNYNFIYSFYECIKTTEKSEQQLKFFSFNRIHFLIKANKTKLKLKPILANLDFLINNNITLHWLDRTKIYILKMAIFSFDNNLRIGKSIYFRYVNSSLNRLKKEVPYNHFLSKEITINKQNLI